MKIKHLAHSERGKVYQVPSIQVFSFLVEHSVLTGSGPTPLEGDCPEGYTIDDEVFKW